MTVSAVGTSSIQNNLIGGFVSTSGEKPSRLQLSDNREDDEELFAVLKKGRLSKSEQRRAKFDEKTLGSGLNTLLEMGRLAKQLKGLKQAYDKTFDGEQQNAIKKEIQSVVSSFSGLLHGKELSKITDIAKSISSQSSESINTKSLLQSLEKQRSVAGTPFISLVKQENYQAIGKITNSLLQLQTIALDFDTENNQILIGSEGNALKPASDDDLDSLINSIENVVHQFTDDEGLSKYLDAAMDEFSKLGPEDEEKVKDFGLHLRASILKSPEKSLAAIAAFHLSAKDPLAVA